MAEINKGPIDPKLIKTGEELFPRRPLVRTVKLTVEVPVQNLVATCKAIQKYGRVLEINKGPKKKKPLAHVMIRDPKLIEIAREIQQGRIEIAREIQRGQRTSGRLPRIIARAP